MIHSGSTVHSALAGSDTAVWVGSLATGAAFVFAVVVYASGVFTAHKERRQAAAVLFDAWVESARWVPEAPETEATDARIMVKVALSNSGVHAMRSVDCDLWFKGEHCLLVDFGTVPPTASGTPQVRMVPIAVPRDMGDTKLPDWTLRGMMALDTTFRDLSGNCWHRTNTGELHLYKKGARPGHRTATNGETG